MADWLSIGAEVMRKARNAKGLSYEGAARLLHVSSKTYERREKLGRWPAHDVSALAEVLGLEIDRPAATRITVQDKDDDADVSEVVERLEVAVSALAEEARRLAAIAARLEKLPPQAVSGQGGG